MKKKGIISASLVCLLSLVLASALLMAAGKARGASQVEFSTLSMQEQEQRQPVPASPVFPAQPLAAAISLNKTVGTNASVCAATDEVIVNAGTKVTYCYQITNTGTVPLSYHDLEDSELGVILNDFPYSLAVGASAFLTQTAIVNQTTVNTATWTAFNAGPSDIAASSDSATVTVPEPAIQLNKTVGANASVCAATDAITVTPGSQVTYCYTVNNSGGVALTRHSLDDSQLGNILNAFPYTLNPGASAFLTQTVTIEATTVNTAAWTAYNPGPTDQVMDVDTATVYVPADLALSKEATPGTVEAGSPLTYTLSVANHGPGRGTGVVLVDTLPAGTSFISASLGCTHTAGEVTCNLGAVENGDTKQVTILLTVPQQEGEIANTAVVSSLDTDPTPENNQASVTTDVIPPVRRTFLPLAMR